MNQLVDTPARPSSDVAAVLAHVGRMTGALHDGDLDAVMAAYADDAAVVFTPADEPVRDASAARSAFEEITSIGARFGYRAHEVVVVGDLALHLAPWSMSGTAPAGTTLEDSGLSVAVLRRQPDASWRLVIDHPHGEHLLAGE